MESLSQNQLLRHISEQLSIKRQGQPPPGRLYHYDTGYGDFFFYSDTERMAKNHRLAERCESQVETSASEPFRLMDLPREIRNEIYKAVVSPMTKSSSSEKLFPEFRGVTLEVYLGREVKLRPVDYPSSASGPEFIANFIHECTAPNICEQTHFQRRTKYPAKSGVRHFNYEISPAGIASLDDLDTIRNLSQTNSMIRMELAEIVWARTSISFDNNSINAFQTLLFDRPAIWHGIKNLRLELSFFKYPADDFEFPIPRSFVDTCEMVSKFLQLESLELIITMEEDDVKQFFRSKAKPNWVKGIRKLPVKNRFDLVLFTLPPDTDDDEEKQHVELQEKYEQRMKGEICPDSLKPKAWDEMTDKERYMQTRL